MLNRTTAPRTGPSRRVCERMGRRLRRGKNDSRRGYSSPCQGGQGQVIETRDTGYETRDMGFSRDSYLVSRVSSFPRHYRFFVMVQTTTSPDLLPPPALPGWDRPLRIGAVELASRFTLAPLAGYTNLPFRLSVRDVGGVGLCTTDLVNARAILKKSERTMELLATCPEDRPLGIQIYGGGPDEM